MHSLLDRGRRQRRSLVTSPLILWSIRFYIHIWLPCFELIIGYLDNHSTWCPTQDIIKPQQGGEPSCHHHGWLCLPPHRASKLGQGFSATVFLQLQPPAVACPWHQMLLGLANHCQVLPSLLTMRVFPTNNPGRFSCLDTACTCWELGLLLLRPLPQAAERPHTFTSPAQSCWAATASLPSSPLAKCHQHSW